MKNRTVWFFLLPIAAFLIATFYSSIQLTATSLDSFSLAFIRFTWATIALGIVIIMQKSTFRIEKKDIVPLFVIGILGQAGATVALTLATRLTDASTTALLVNTSPFWVFLIGVLLKREHYLAKRLGGIMLGLVGIYFVIMGKNNFSLVFSFKQSVGYLAALAASLGVAIFGIFAGSYSKKYGFLLTTFYAFFSSTLFLFICVAFYQIDFRIFFLPENILIGCYIGVFSIGIPRLITVAALRNIKPSRVYPFNLLIPVFTAILGMVFFQEFITLQFIFGVSLVLIGLYFTQTKEFINVD